MANSSLSRLQAREIGTSMTAMPATPGCIFAVPSIRRLDIATAVSRSTACRTIQSRTVQTCRVINRRPSATHHPYEPDNRSSRSITPAGHRPFEGRAANNRPEARHVGSRWNRAPWKEGQSMRHLFFAGSQCPNLPTKKWSTRGRPYPDNLSSENVVPGRRQSFDDCAGLFVSGRVVVERDRDRSER